MLFGNVSLAAVGTEFEDWLRQILGIPGIPIKNGHDT